MESKTLIEDEWKKLAGNIKFSGVRDKIDDRGLKYVDTGVGELRQGFFCRGFFLEGLNTPGIIADHHAVT